MSITKEEFKSKTLTLYLSELEFYEKLFTMFGENEIISKDEVEQSRNFFKEELKEFLANPSPNKSTNQ